MEERPHTAAYVASEVKNLIAFFAPFGSSEPFDFEAWRRDPRLSWQEARALLKPMTAETQEDSQRLRQSELYGVQKDVLAILVTLKSVLLNCSHLGAVVSVREDYLLAMDRALSIEHAHQWRHG